MRTMYGRAKNGTLETKDDARILSLQLIPKRAGLIRERQIRHEIH